jgi:glycosyltransferase involved in cell wall biosynthesis
VLVLPSLGDSFGFIALEAMACGLPVVVTMAVGVPLPSERWRIAANCSESIREQLSEYADDRDLLASDGDLASRFAAAYTPKSYRERAGLIFSSLLCDGAPS